MNFTCNACCSWSWPHGWLWDSCDHAPPNCTQRPNLFWGSWGLVLKICRNVCSVVRAGVCPWIARQFDAQLHWIIWLKLKFTSCTELMRAGPSTLRLSKFVLLQRCPQRPNLIWGSCRPGLQICRNVCSVVRAGGCPWIARQFDAQSHRIIWLKLKFTSCAELMRTGPSTLRLSKFVLLLRCPQRPNLIWGLCKPGLKLYRNVCSAVRAGVCPWIARQFDAQSHRIIWLKFNFTGCTALMHRAIYLIRQAMWAQLLN